MTTLNIPQTYSSKIVDTVNDDGTVTRVTTTSYPNGDTNVLTHTFSVEQYIDLTTQLQNQISDLTSKLENTTQIKSLMQEKLQTTPVEKNNIIN